MPKFRFLLCLSLLALVALAPAAIAQVTTGNIAGNVTTRQDNSALPGVTVEAVHTPTGTRYSTVAGANGYYLIPNARVGGPYRVTATLEGFKPTTAENVEVRIGETTNVPLALGLATVSEAITVTAVSDPIINPNHTGSESQVSTKQIENLPTVNRSLQDFARTNPYFTVDASDATATVVNVAGRNNRYNNIQIDGAVNNDLFGLAGTGTPGGQANTQPISLDAIQQLQLVVSPYDVRQGGFTGGGINAVTRSGANRFEGSVFGTKRNPSYVGKWVKGQNTSAPGFVDVNKPFTTFKQSQYGGRIGGPILRDRLFFFTSGERNRLNQPNGTSADGSAATNYANATQDAVCGGVASCSAARLGSILKTKYNYDPGPLGDITKNNPSDLFFGRLDFNANNSNSVTVRHNYVSASNDVIADRSASRFRFPSSIYSFESKTNSSVAQANSVFSATMFNEARIGYQTIREHRTTPVIFPSIEIGGANQNATLNAGTERFSGANALDQKITELTDDFTLVRGNHQFVFGTHNEIFKFKNLFLSEFYGYYFFPTVAAFEQGAQPTEYRISFANGSNPRAPVAFKASQYGLYGSDTWHVNNNLSLVLGLRADRPQFPDTPVFNPLVSSALPGYSTSFKPKNTIVWSPRLGFNWNPLVGGNQQVRGGLGIFSGRAPYVWISNAYGGTGIATVALVCTAATNCTRPAFNPDPNNQPRNLNVTGGGAVSVDMVDPNFKFPRVLRGTLGYDRDLIFGIRGTVEALYSKVQEDIYYINANRTQSGTSALDGRPTYSLVSTQIFDATFLTNTTKGHEFTQTLQFIRPFTHGLTMGASYAHQDAKSAFEGTSSRAISNWRFEHTKGDIFTPAVANSVFLQKHRFNASVTYDLPTGPVTHTFGLYWNAQSGRPYSLLFGTDINKDQYATNDLLYIPGGADKMILCPSQTPGSTVPTAAAPCGTGRTALDASIFSNFVSSAGINPNQARILNKYESFEPWSRTVDFHYSLALPVRTVRAQIDADILNLLHMLNKDWGNVYFISNQNTSPVTYLGQDPGTGKPVYREASTTLNADGTRNFGSLTPGKQFQVADLRSRWQARLGLRLSF
ncbi:MAG TPA: TonB-dependent receptor [Thermoanaerobaculia bacterium]|nr:TonB-dependent receptor [Thermoanaerobaculia bacterium]